MYNKRESSFSNLLEPMLDEENSLNCPKIRAFISFFQQNLDILPLLLGSRAAIAPSSSVASRFIVAYASSIEKNDLERVSVYVNLALLFFSLALVTYYKCKSNLDILFLRINQLICFSSGGILLDVFSSLSLDQYFEKSAFLAFAVSTMVVYSFISVYFSLGWQKGITDIFLPEQNINSLQKTCNMLNVGLLLLGTYAFSEFLRECVGHTVSISDYMAPEIYIPIEVCLSASALLLSFNLNSNPKIFDAVLKLSVFLFNLAAVFRVFSSIGSSVNYLVKNNEVESEPSLELLIAEGFGSFIIAVYHACHVRFDHESNDLALNVIDNKVSSICRSVKRCSARLFPCVASSDNDVQSSQDLLRSINYGN